MEVAVNGYYFYVEKPVDSRRTTRYGDQIFYTSMEIVRCLGMEEGLFVFERADGSMLKLKKLSSVYEEHNPHRNKEPRWISPNPNHVSKLFK
ncbi:MAG: hypothetical protein MJZ30_06050 [Paludibacteraceae bacterium]|nr:hypothetical protein [Paludibacteraceae bacterium]